MSLETGIKASKASTFWCEKKKVFRNNFESPILNNSAFVLSLVEWDIKTLEISFEVTCGNNWRGHNLYDQF